MGLFRLLMRLFGGGGRRRRRRVAASRPPSASPQSIRPRELAVVRTRIETQVTVVQQAPQASVLRGRCWVVDGDTIMIGEVRLRLAGIDAPELDHPYGKQSKWALVQLCKGQIVTAHIRPELSYDRLVADCYLPDGRDLAAELVRSGLALDWPKFSGGKYRHLEPEGVRRKLWRADARQRGLLRQESNG